MANEIKDSGKTREFSTGSHRDMSVGKGRMDLVPAYAVQRAKAVLDYWMEDMCTKKYTIKQFLNEALNAATAYIAGDTDQDYLAIAAANALCALGKSESSQMVEGYDIDSQTDLLSIWASGLLAVSKHYEAGALKYGENNWMKGQPMHVLLDSGMRHNCKALAGITDEPHLRALAWNYLGAIWTEKNLPEMQDIPTRS